MPFHPRHFMLVSYTSGASVRLVDHGAYGRREDIYRSSNHEGAAMGPEDTRVWVGTFNL